MSTSVLGFTDLSLYLGKICSVPKVEKKIKTKKKTVPTPSTKTEEAEDGESHHPCRKSTVIYSLVAQPTEEDRHC